LKSPVVVQVFPGDDFKDMTMRMILRTVLLVGFAVASAHAAILIAPISGQFPDVFAACSGCTELAYLSETGTTISNNLNFTLNTAVYEDPDNTFCADCLDFVYQVINSATSTDNVGRVTAITFTGFQADVGYSTGGEPADGGTAFPTGTIAPGLVDRNSADTIGFQFSSSPSAVIPPGAASTVLVIETDAKTFSSGFVSIIDGGATNEAAFQPASAPEPGTALLLGLGMIGLAGVRRLRRG
jgi:hypothetical protein